MDKEDAHSRSQTGSLNLYYLGSQSGFFLFRIIKKNSEILCANIDNLEGAEEGFPWSGVPQLDT